MKISFAGLSVFLVAAAAIYMLWNNPDIDQYSKNDRELGGFYKFFKD